MNRLADFLPKMAQANQELESKLETGESLDIEAVDEDEQHIEMNLDLGVFDIQTNPEEQLDLSQKPIELSLDKLDDQKKKADVIIQEIVKSVDSDG